MWLRYMTSSRRSSLLGQVAVPCLSPSFMIHMRSRNMGGRPLFMAASAHFAHEIPTSGKREEREGECRATQGARAQTCEDFAHFLEFDLLELGLVVVRQAHSLRTGRRCMRMCRFETNRTRKGYDAEAKSGCMHSKQYHGPSEHTPARCFPSPAAPSAVSICCAPAAVTALSGRCCPLQTFRSPPAHAPRLRHPTLPSPTRSRCAAGSTPSPVCGSAGPHGGRLITNVGRARICSM